MQKPTDVLYPDKSGPSRPADLLLVNARVLTLDPGQPRAEAVAVLGERIVAVGARVQVNHLAGPGTRTIDCQGMALLPGLIDAHCHLLALAASLQGLDCGPGAVSSIGELRRAIRRRADATPAGQWIRGYGYDESAFSEGRHPTRWDLDQATPHHPVRLDHRSGHAIVLNSRALEAAGIQQDTADPLEGVIVRDDTTGEITGLLLELGAFLRERLGATRESAQLEAGVVLLNRKLLSCGVTSVQDAGANNSPARWEVFRELQASGRLLCRITMLAGATRLEEYMSTGLSWGSRDDRLRLGHAKVMLTLTTGALHPDLPTLREVVAVAHAHGFPVAIHAVEREAVAAAVQALGEAWARPGASRPHNSSFRPRDRIEHCSECPPELVAQVRRSGAAVVTQPGLVYWNGGRYRKEVEPSLLGHLYPVGALNRAGVPVAFGSDAPVIDLNPWPAIYSAVTRETREGGPLIPPEHPGTKVDQRITVESALRMYTVAAACAEGSEQRKGTIRPGKLADLVLVDNDPTTVTHPRIKDIRAVMTILGGRIVWQDGFPVLSY
jgi:hypothetical protein